MASPSTCITANPICSPTSKPSVIDDGTYRFWFSSRCIGHHPYDPHIHVVKRNGEEAAFHLNPVALRKGRHSIPDHELSRIRTTIEGHEAFMLEKWHAHFG